ncbi:hypothetical protein LHJ74_19610 [Streptomyces sp. N2-109]|uniref:Secreted protein n=1 Tax=Streptomyces gossypii TaxID=2883101 RepID=A0ABT2JW01_9ACTN|nr:hypothetical protein [Streptomyces gossypii]MCT2592082.1 hypothetical protein [Streptomyces gossypii]
MNNGLKIAAFAAALAATFGAAYGVGNGVGPVDAEPAGYTGHKEHQKQRDGGGGEGNGGAEAGLPGGLQVSEGGYRLDLMTRSAEEDRSSSLRFRVLDQQGRKVTAYQKEHGKELHLILASRDLSTYRHLHPSRAEDGTWSTPVKLPKAGDYRVFADFTPDAKGARNLTLGADLAVSGSYQPETLPKPDRTAEVDGYTVTLDGGLRPGAARELTLKVAKDGRPVTDLQPYLGAYGHLVALRDGDLAYLHVHPGGEIGDDSVRPGPEVSFSATAPSAGSYRLFLDFRHEGKVRTAAFTVTADGAADKPAPDDKPEPNPEADPGHQH